MYLHPRSVPGLMATSGHVPARIATPLQTVKGGRHG